ncbi:MAG: hypothetical protein LBI53_05635 [Candidatus Peribacteria bacterium]|nr:hypothetical protein [Candidatus Peribacteria bacterium]
MVAGNLLALLVVCGSLRWKDSTNVLTRVGNRNIPLMKENRGNLVDEQKIPPAPLYERG